MGFGYSDANVIPGLAEENADDTTILPPGNQTSTITGGSEFDMTFEDFNKRVAVAVFARSPNAASKTPQPDKVQIELVCLRAKKVDDPNRTESPTSTVAGGGASPTGSNSSQSSPGGATSLSISAWGGWLAGVFGILAVFA